MTGNVLITGASGRIGSLLMRSLPVHGWSVRGCDVNAAPDVVTADITSLADMMRAAEGCGAIIHLAGTPNAKPGWAAVTHLNIHGTRTVLEAARRCGVAQVIFASSIHAVGALAADSPLGPDLPPAPSGIYGVSKLAGEALLRLYAAKFGLSCTAVRICSFRPEPQDARELKTWLGHADTVHLFDRCLNARTSGYRMVWGVSANSRLSIHDPVADEIDYRPTQNAEDHVGRLPNPNDTLWRGLGGPVFDDAEVDWLD